MEQRDITLSTLDALNSLALSWEALEARALHWWYGLRLGPARLTFFRQMAQFEKNGVLLQRALGLCMMSCGNPRFREALRSVLFDVGNGVKLHRAMAARPGEFSEMLVAMVEAGEEGAGFALVLDRIARLLERDKRVFGKVQRALYYPAAVFLGVIGLIVYLVTSFVPQFTQIAASYGQKPSGDLERLTQVGMLFVNPLALTAMLVGIALLAVLVRGVLKRPAVAYGYDRLLLRIPLIGPIRKKAVLATLSRLLGAMLFTGVPYDKTLTLVAQAVPSPVYRKAVFEIRGDILANGGTFTGAAAKTGLFELDYLSLVAAGEESKSASEMLETIAGDYDGDVERDLDAATAILEPVLIAALGLLVMLVVGTVYGSLYSMISKIH
jgi:type IV pilus assembly protein PilC